MMWWCVHAKPEILHNASIRTCVHLERMYESIYLTIGGDSHTIKFIPCRSISHVLRAISGPSAHVSIHSAHTQRWWRLKERIMTFYDAQHMLIQTHKNLYSIVVPQWMCVWSAAGLFGKEKNSHSVSHTLRINAHFNCQMRALRLLASGIMQIWRHLIDTAPKKIRDGNMLHLNNSPQIHLRQ
jgi:hypothetical protein